MDAASPEKRPAPPPPPPRSRPGPSDAPPPYTEHPLSSLQSGDPRSSSTQSLVPADRDSRDVRRKLLLIYIHGFMGNETSFQSFPAHVHNLVTLTLSDTHVVHTKIYPRYRSRRAIEFAAEDFSKWLAPHATPETDIILCGHSMGGLLSAEVVLLPPQPPPAGKAFRHRILGIINFDVPFLGMHPGVISSGLSSIFRPAEEKSPEDKARPTGTQSNSSQSLQHCESTDSSVSTLNLGPPVNTGTLFSANPSDPNYNPAFANDVVLPVRKGWSNALHFINKHSDGIIKASKQAIKSHLEFGGAMADYGSLKRRYTRVRALEEEDEAKRKSACTTQGARTVPRVRFVNYYTASTGRPKKVKSPSPSGSKSMNLNEAVSMDAGMSNPSLTASSSQDPGFSPTITRSPHSSIEQHRDGTIIPKIPEELPSPVDSDVESPRVSYEMQRMSPTPLADSEEELPSSSSPPERAASPPPPERTASAATTAASSSLNNPELPTIPSPPTEPTPPDLSACPDKESRKLAEKDHDRALKAYKRAVKDRNGVIKDRAKLEEKIAKEVKKAEQKAAAAAAKEKKARKEEKEKEKEAEERGDVQKSGEELRLEREKQRVEAETKRMAEGEKERMRVQRRMLGLPPEEAEDDDGGAANQHVDAGIEGEGENKDSSIMATADGKKKASAELRRPPQASPLPPRSRSHSPAPRPSHRQQPSASTQRSLSPSAYSPSPSAHNKTPQPTKPPRDRKFCMLPPKDPITGKRDPTWVRVYMEGVDEVGAHCGLFFVGETYERLVGEMAETIEKWVLDDVSERAVRELESQIL